MSDKVVHEWTEDNERFQLYRVGDILYVQSREECKNLSCDLYVARELARLAEALKEAERQIYNYKNAAMDKAEENKRLEKSLHGATSGAADAISELRKCQGTLAIVQEENKRLRELAVDMQSFLSSYPSPDLGPHHKCWAARTKITQKVQEVIDGK